MKFINQVKKFVVLGFSFVYKYIHVVSFGLLMYIVKSFFDFDLIIYFIMLSMVCVILYLLRLYINVRIESLVLLFFYMPPIKIDGDEVIERIYRQCYKPLAKYWNDSWSYPGEGEIPEPYLVKERVNYLIGDVLGLNPNYADMLTLRVPFRHYLPGSHIDDLEIEPYLYGLRWGLEHMPGNWSGLHRLHLIEPLRDGFFDSGSGISFHFYSFYFIELGLTGGMLLYVFGRLVSLYGPILLAAGYSHLKGQVLARIISDRVRNGQLDVYEYWNSLSPDAQVYLKQRMLGYVHLKGIYVKTLYLKVNQSGVWNFVESLIVDSFQKSPVTMHEIVHACIQVGLGYVDTLCVIYILIFK